jgi:hypothetical protein
VGQLQIDDRKSLFLLYWLPAFATPTVRYWRCRLVLVGRRRQDLEHATEVFLTPWNNQVGFFAFALYFWLFSRGRAAELPAWLFPTVGAVTGLTVATREEYLLFLFPLEAAFLIFARHRKRDLMTFVIAAVGGYLPQLLIKMGVTGELLSTARVTDGGASYTEKLAGYFSAAACHTT